MEPSFDFYAELGVDPSAKHEEIHKAYRRLAREFHTDGGGGNEERLKRVNEAWDTLRDAGRRDAYDRSQRDGGGHRPTTTGRRLVPDRLDLGKVSQGETGT